MSGVLKLVALMAVVVGSLDAYRMVLAPDGTCVEKRVSYFFLLTVPSHCEAMGGWNGTLQGYDDHWCFMDLCDLPAEGPVARGAVWSIDADLSHESLSWSRTVVGVPMIRRDCDNIHGRYDGNPTSDKIIACLLFFTKRDGSDRQNIDTLILAGAGECDNKVAKMPIFTIQRECLLIGGEWYGDPGATDWVQCFLDICVSPVIKCEPSDLWSTIQTCRNPSSASFTCSFRFTTGIMREQSSSSTYGGSMSASITSEVGVQLKGIFTASVSTTFETGFQWSSTAGSRQTWSESTTRTLSVEMEAGEAVSIKQVVGVCGDFRVDTTEFRVVDVPLYRNTRDARAQTVLRKLFRRG